MALPLLTKEEVIDRLFQVFQHAGYDGATLSQLSKETGLGKSSLYHYFPGGKEDMAIAVLNRINDWLQQQVIRPLQGEGLPQTRLIAMLHSFSQIYDNGSKSCVLGNLVIGNCRSRFQTSLQVAFSAWISALEGLAMEADIPAEEARARAELVVVIIEGGLVLALGMNEPLIYQRALTRIPDILLGETSL